MDTGSSFSSAQPWSQPLPSSFSSPPSTKSHLQPIDHSPWLKAGVISIGKHKHVNKSRFMTHASSCWHREAEGVKKNTSFFQSLALNAAKLGLPFPSLSSTHGHAPLRPHSCLASAQTVRAGCQHMRCVNGFYLHSAAAGKASTNTGSRSTFPVSYGIFPVLLSSCPSTCALCSSSLYEGSKGQGCWEKSTWMGSWLCTPKLP